MRPRSSSVKRNRVPSDDNSNVWEEVQYRRNGERPVQKRIRQSYWGNDANNTTAAELTGADQHEVFLCNYKKLATESMVKEHFKDKHKLSVISVRTRSHPEADVKSFVMKLAVKEDFDKAMKVLPYKTGARWYQRGFNQEKKPRVFNNTSFSADFILRRPADSALPVPDSINATPPPAAVTPPSVTTSTASDTASSDTNAFTAGATASGGQGFSVQSIMSSRSSGSAAPLFNIGGPLSLNNASMSLGSGSPSS